MAKANLVLSDGTKVDIEGTVEEVALLLEKFSQPLEKSTSSSGGRKRSKKKAKSSSGGGKTKKGPQALIANLVEEDYFKTKRTIADIQKKLEEKGHIYAQTSLSTPLVRLTRNRTLRRLKEKKGWAYVS